VQCAICQKHYVMRVDRDDLARVVYGIGGVLLQDACPYLSAVERELLLTATCETCWDSLCVPNSKFGYE
jgi:hypothetical protein